LAFLETETPKIWPQNNTPEENHLGKLERPKHDQMTKMVVGESSVASPASANNTRYELLEVWRSNAKAMLLGFGKSFDGPRFFGRRRLGCDPFFGGVEVDSFY